MFIYILIGLILGGLAGFFLGKWWAAVIAVLAPLPLYLGTALGIWGNGFGENWQYTTLLWVVPVCAGFFIGTMFKRQESYEL